MTDKDYLEILWNLNYSHLALKKINDRNEFKEGESSLDFVPLI